jgi:hypothetical protein
MYAQGHLNVTVAVASLSWLHTWTPQAGLEQKMDGLSMAGGAGGGVLGAAVQPSFPVPAGVPVMPTAGGVGGMAMPVQPGYPQQPVMPSQPGIAQPMPAMGQPAMGMPQPGVSLREETQLCERRGRGEFEGERGKERQGEMRE